MTTLIRKHWTSLLGVMFILAAFITLFKYSIDQGWITDGMKIGIGLLCGSGVAITGLALINRGVRYSTASQVLIGLGACLLYSTFSFAGIYYGLWSPITVLIGMTAVTAGVSAYAYRFDSRLLMSIALAGGLLSPLFMRPETDQVFTLFFYLLVLNTAFFSLSIVKGWSELRIGAFLGTWIVYVVYFVHFDPPVEGLWSMPFRYVLAAFLYYVIGFMVSSWKSNLRFDGWNLYLSLANGILFGCWSTYILNGDLNYAYILGFIGAIYLIAGSFIYRLTGRTELASASHWIGGLLTLLLACAQFGSGMDTKPIINVFVWGTIAGGLGILGQSKQWMLARIFSVLVWFIVGTYWFIVTWDTPRGEWFGAYIPFLNWGAMAWVLLAAIGFYYSVKNIVPQATRVAEEQLSNLFAIVAHLIVGGLLTVQIQNLYIVYFDEASDQLQQLTLSVSWGIYALLLFVWGAYRREAIFRWFGTAVLLIVAAKAIFIDLDGEEMLYKVLVLLILGGISFLISWINGKWNPASSSESADLKETKHSTKA
jgi:uncharacterized membrane protein